MNAATIRTAASKHINSKASGRAFIADVANELNITDIAAFKRTLLAMHQAGELTLGRCDLSNLHSQALVRASEIKYLSAEFHFICA